MKKLYTYVLLAMIWSCALFGFAGIGVLADDAYAGVFDDAGILTEEEKSGLSSQIQALETEYQIHLLIVTTEDTQAKRLWIMRMISSRNIMATAHPVPGCCY